MMSSAHAVRHGAIMAGRWQVLDAESPKGNDVAVTPRPGTRRGEPRSGAQRHEDELLHLLYEQHAGPLLMFVSRLTGGDMQRAEDIVQETLLRAWRNAHKLGVNGETSLRPWLVTVARRIAIDEFRSESARVTETYDRDLEAFPTTDETDRVLGMMTVVDALRALSDAHREILVETYFRGRSVPEAAQALGLPLGTAKSRVYYALRALRTALEERGVTR
ncbi:RNA polymerase sigma factor [Pilimelia anulata]|uniref:RNA polymerase sigma factor n=2 Tax=Pilimelia anulata TaxID=53371 RepID=A0A8J3B6K7_9ACTN|nr:RNA polymerase sigma factor [Pilimelia anulata]